MIARKFVSQISKVLVITLLCFVSGSVRGQIAPSPDKPTIKWMSLEEAYLAIQKEPRKIIVDIYTNWCGWCKVMNYRAFRDPRVIAYVNEKFYMVKLDAEHKDDIVIGDKRYAWVVGYNEAALYLMQGKIHFPTMVYLDEKFNIIQPLPGYQDEKVFHQIATYFGENYFKNKDWNEYQQAIYPQQFK